MDELLLQGLRRAIHATGGGNREYLLAEAALKRMGEIGIVKAEDLRSGLAEALPGAVRVAAKALGMSQQELEQRVEQGTMSAATFLGALAREL